ncbi:MAG: hypothetical protein ACR2PZ_25400 [Pseudomonadales bacterium]
MNTGIKHPFSGALYELTADGNVSVSNGEQTGLFQPDGQWISGVLRECDPQLCVWITDIPPPPDELESTSHLATK